MRGKSIQDRPFLDKTHKEWATQRRCSDEERMHLSLREPVHRANQSSGALREAVSWASWALARSSSSRLALRRSMRGASFCLASFSRISRRVLTRVTTVEATVKMVMSSRVFFQRLGFRSPRSVSILETADGSTVSSTTSMVRLSFMSCLPRSLSLRHSKDAKSRRILQVSRITRRLSGAVEQEVEGVAGCANLLVKARHDGRRGFVVDRPTAANDGARANAKETPRQAMKRIRAGVGGKAGGTRGQHDRGAALEAREHKQISGGQAAGIVGGIGGEMQRGVHGIGRIVGTVRHEMNDVIRLEQRFENGALGGLGAVQNG